MMPPHTLIAGAARVSITPAGPQYLDGYGNRTGRSEGVYLPIHARSLYLGHTAAEALLVSAEVLAFDRPQADRIRAAIAAATGIPAPRIVLAATHTHCAPRVCGTMMPGSVDPAYRAWFEEQLVAVARSATADPRPVRVTYSEVTGMLGINRRVTTPEGTLMRPNPAGVNDARVRTVWLEFEEGEPVASATVYACHPTSRGGPLIGGDYPGFFCRTLEAQAGGIALFCLGCAGDIRPNFTDADGRFRPAEIDEVEAVGRALGEAACRGRTARRPVAAGGVRVAGEEVCLPFAQLPTAGELAAIAAADPNPLRRTWAEKTAARLDEGLPESAPFEIQILALSPGLAWIFMAGEVVVDYAQALSRDARPLVIPAAYANGSVGYVPSRRIHPEGGYEVNGSHFYYDQPAPFRVDVEERILAAAARLLEGAMEEA